MYRKSLILMIAGLLLWGGLGVTMHAQDYIAPDVEISKEKIRIDGKIFLSHVVKERQTLYSISKAYGTSIEELYKYNPKLREEGLKKNSILLVPFEEKNGESTSLKKEGNKEKAEIQTPDKKERKRQDRGDFKKMKTHVVKWYEDIKSIAAKYNVSINAIMEANNLVDKKLSARQKLVIPAEGTGLDNQAEETETPDSGNDKIVPAEEQTAAAGKGTAESGKEGWNGKANNSKPAVKKRLRSLFSFPKTSISLSMMLPLQAKEGKASRNFMDFYSGALLAVKHLGEEGVNTDMRVFDTSHENIISKDEEIKKSDMIIGPVNAEQIAELYTINTENIPVISPLDPRTEKLAENYSNFIFAPTSHSKQYEDLCNWISEDYIPENRVIVIFEKNGYKTNYHPEVLANLQKKGISYTEFAYNILEGREIINSLEMQMTPESTNRVIIASESEAFVNDVVRNINLLTLKNLDIILYAGGKIRSFETIETEYLHNARLHTTMSYNTDYDSEKVMRFLKEYRALYNTEPSQFAIQGYDVTKYFVDMYSKYGSFWLECITGETVPMLQSSFRFEKTAAGSFVNYATRRVVYGKDFIIYDNYKSSID